MNSSIGGLSAFDGTHIVESTAGVQLDADPTGEDPDELGQDLDRETRAVLDAAAVCVRADVCGVVEELDADDKRITDRRSVSGCAAGNGA